MFQAITTLLILTIMMLPFFLPHTVTGYKPRPEPIMIPVFTIWGNITAMIMAFCSASYIIHVMGKLYDYLRK